MNNVNPELGKSIIGITPEVEKNIVDNFHILYYYSQVWGFRTKWMGVPCHQNPMDMWILQEIIFEKRPTVIIETGTLVGGSALFFAHMMDNAELPGVIFTIDMGFRCIVKHPRIISFQGEKSTSGKFLDALENHLKGDDRVMVFLDSDHNTENVIEEMRLFSPFVTSDQYMIVCDSNVGGNPIHNPFVSSLGPMEAIRIFMGENDQFEIDREREKFFFTFCPSGFLRKKEV